MRKAQFLPTSKDGGFLAASFVISWLMAFIAIFIAWNGATLSEAKNRDVSPPAAIVAGTLQPSLTYQKQNGRYVFTFTVKNQTEREQTITFTSGQKYDYILYRNGKKVMQFSDGKVFTQIYEKHVLKQGEELSFKETVPRLSKGRYTFTWWLADRNWPNAKASITFTVK